MMVGPSLGSKLESVGPTKCKQLGHPDGRKCWDGICFVGRDLVCEEGW